MRVRWVACGTCYTKTGGIELGGIELQCSSYFFFVRVCVCVWGEGGGGSL